MAVVTLSYLPGRCLEVPEYDLIGMICAAVTLEINSLFLLPFDIEVSLIEQPKKFPIDFGKSWTYKHKRCDLIQFCTKLQTEQTESHLEVFPIFGSNTTSMGTKYCIPEIHHNEFMHGYMRLNTFLRNCLSDNIETENNHDCKDDWSPNIEFLSASKLANTPKDGINTNRVHVLRVPAYIWDLPKIDDIYQEQLAANLIGLFLRDCDPEDHIRLMDKKSYLRFLLFQDAPNSYPYAYGYIRTIADCTYQSHKNSLNGIGSDKLPCEVTLRTKGFFWEFPLDEWKNKSIQHLREFL